jgi:hypothetical protein
MKWGRLFEIMSKMLPFLTFVGGFLALEKFYLRYYHNLDPIPYRRRDREMRRLRYRWRKEEHNRLIREYKDGLSYEDLAGRHGKSIASIRSRLYEIRNTGID